MARHRAARCVCVCIHAVLTLEHAVLCSAPAPMAPVVRRRGAAGQHRWAEHVCHVRTLCANTWRVAWTHELNNLYHTRSCSSRHTRTETFLPPRKSTRAHMHLVQHYGLGPCSATAQRHRHAETRTVVGQRRKTPRPLQAHIERMLGGTAQPGR